MKNDMILVIGGPLILSIYSILPIVYIDGAMMTVDTVMTDLMI